MWTKLDDNFPDHPKVLAAGACGAWLYVCGLCYSNRYLTDGHIPTALVRRLADIPDPDGTAQRLVEVGLWEQVEGGYRVHDFHDFNMDAESAKARRDEISRVRAEAGKKGMAARWGDNKITNGITNELLTGLSTADNKTITPIPIPIPIPIPLPDPIPVERDVRAPAPARSASPKPQKAPTKKTSIPAHFEVTDKMLDWVERTLPDLKDVMRATDEWADYCLREDAKFANWEAAWRQGMRKALEFQREREARNGKSNGKSRQQATEEYFAAIFNANGAGASPSPIDRPRLRGGPPETA